MVSRLDELLQTFSVQNAYSRATLSHPRCYRTLDCCFGRGIILSC